MNLKEVSFKVNRNSQHTVAFYKIDTFGVNVRFFVSFFSLILLPMVGSNEGIESIKIEP